tara:strand:- start:454 stop:1629 length:1176 start_codon:yes stop_codon:yes gene_type:complete
MMDDNSKIECFINIYNKLDINKQKNTIDLIKKIIINIETKYNNRIKYRNLYNISLLNFDILLMNYIIGYVCDLDKIVNLSLTCKVFYNELKYFLINSRSIINHIFSTTNNCLFTNYFENSYYNILNLKYFFNTKKIPLPNNNDKITYLNINNTLIIYYHYFFDNFLFKTHVIDFYFNLTKLLYPEYTINNDISIKNNFFNISYLFCLFKGTYVCYNPDYYYYYTNDISNDLFSCNLTSYLYYSDAKVFKNEFDIYKILIFIKYKKFNDLIELIESLELIYYNYIPYLNLKYYNNMISNAKVLLESNTYNKFIKITFLSFYLEYFNNILHIVSDDYYEYILDDIKEVTIDISNYYFNLKELRPRYFQTYIEERYFNLLSNLTNKLQIDVDIF